jgi:hypothetical protein
MDLNAALSGMVAIPGGTFTMGSTVFYPEEAPLRRVKVDPFHIDATPVTNADFARFVEATGYRTFAETAPDPSQYPGMDPALAVPGSLVFTMTDRPVDTSDPSQWWRWVPGADWAHPTGPDSSIDDILDHPVVQVVHQDALAYATWACKSLPTEAEHEFAARGDWSTRNTPGVMSCCPAACPWPTHGMGFSLWQHAGRWLAAHQPGTVVPGQWLWPLRHDRQCLGMVRGLVEPARGGGEKEIRLLRHQQSARWFSRQEL